MVQFLVVSFLFGLMHSISGETAVVGGAKRLTVKLHKQLVSVRSEGKVVGYKSAYFGTIFLGGPVPQEFSMVFDTGSGHVVLPSSACKSTSCQSHRRYNRIDSVDARDIDYDGQPIKPNEARDAITIAFGTGEVTGEFVQERLCLPPPVSDDLLLDDSANAPGELNDCVDMRIVTATEMTDEPFQSFAFDGVLGLGLEGLALAPEFSFFSRMVAQGSIALPEFAVFLAQHEDDESEITFGGFNPDHLSGELVWSPVSLPELGHWQVEILRIRVGGNELDACGGADKCHAVVDTGTSLLAAPKDLHAQLQVLLGTEVPPFHGGGCSGLPGSRLEFDLMGGFTVALEVGDLARTRVQRPPANVNSTESPRTVCVPTIMPLTLPAPLGPNLFILGEPVLRKYYTVYNWERSEIGFGRAKESAEFSPELFSPELQVEAPLIV